MEKDRRQEVERKPLLLPGFNAIDKYFDWLVKQNGSVLDIVNDAYDRLGDFLKKENEVDGISKITEEDLLNAFELEFHNTILARDGDGDKVILPEVDPKTLEWIAALGIKERRDVFRKLGVIVYSERGIHNKEEYSGVLDFLFNPNVANEIKAMQVKERR